MENVADALKMAAAVLVFIIAIGSSFSLFGTAKQTADSIIGMRDKQAYLEAAEEDVGGILYTSTSSIKGDETETDITKEYVSGVTKKGDRVVKVDDVISTIYRYSKEKYGVTIIKSTGEVIARFDSNTENIMNQYNNVNSDKLKKYEEKLEKNTATSYVSNPSFGGQLKELYKVNRSDVGAPWYGNNEEIQKRINADISRAYYAYNGQTYEGKGLLDELSGKKIIEVTNEIDQSEYLKDNNEKTDLLQKYSMPTIEVVYIVYEQ